MFRVSIAVLLASLIAVSLTENASAAVLAADDFESYAVGSQLHTLNGGTGWTGAWTVPTAARRPESTIVGSGLSYTGGEIMIDGGGQSFSYAATEAGIDVLAGRQTSAITNDVVYLSFTYQNSANNNGTTSDNDFIQLGLDTSVTNPRMSAMDRDGLYQLRSTTASGNSFLTGVPSEIGETAFLVLRAEKTGGSATYNDLKLYVNPTDLDESVNLAQAVTTLDTGLDLSGNAFVAIRKAFFENGDTMQFDNLRIGTDFSDVVDASGVLLEDTRQDIFVDPFDVDPASNGWTEASTGGANPGSVFENGSGQVLLASDGLNVDGNDFDTTSITRTIDATGFYDLQLTLDVADDADNGLEADDIFSILVDTGSGFVPIEEVADDFGGAAVSNALTLGPLSLSLADNSIFQLRIQGTTNVEDYLLDNLVVSGRQVQAVPEPASMLTWTLLGLGSAIWLRLRKRKIQLAA